MNNIKRAADVIDQWTQEGHELNSAVGSPHAIAKLLSDAGLLAPDLPAPDECPPYIHQPGWKLGEDKYAAVVGGSVHISDRYGWGLSYNPEEIRRAAYRLLAAAEYAEGGRE